MTLQQALAHPSFDAMVYGIRAALWADTHIFTKTPELAIAQRLRAVRIVLTDGDATFSLGGHTR